MKTGFRFGIITGLAICAYVLTEYALGFHTTDLDIGKYSGYGASLIPIATIVLALYQQRKKAGTFLFKEGIQIGFTIAFIAAIITTIFFYIYNSYINEGWMQVAAELEKQKMIAEGVSQEIIDKFSAQMEKMSNPWMQAISGFIGSTTLGVIITLIASAIMKKTK